MYIELVETSSPAFIRSIGKLRAEIWLDEGYLLANVCQNGIWLDELDFIGKHWIAFAEDELVAAARLTFHKSLEDMPHSDEFSPYDLAVDLPYAFMA